MKDIDEITTGAAPPTITTLRENVEILQTHGWLPVKRSTQPLFLGECSFRNDGSVTGGHGVEANNTPDVCSSFGRRLLDPRSLPSQRPQTVQG